MCQRSKLTGFNQDNVFRILHFAFNHEKSFLSNQETKALEQVWIDNRIGDSGFVFQTDEDKPFRRSRALPTNDVAPDLNRCPVTRVDEIGRAPNIWYTFAQRFHWMRTSR